MIPHNLKPRPYRIHPRWYLGAKSTDYEFVFIDSCSLKEVKRSEGWTLEDALSFNDMLCAGTIYARPPKLPDAP